MANRSAHEASEEGALRTSVEGAVSVVIVKGVEVSPPPGLVCGKSSICAAPMNGKGDSVPAPKQAECLQEACRNVVASLKPPSLARLRDCSRAKTSPNPYDSIEIGA